MSNNQLLSSTSVTGSPPCPASSNVNALLSSSCHVSETALALQSNAALTCTQPPLRASSIGLPAHASLVTPPVAAPGLNSFDVSKDSLLLADSEAPPAPSMGPPGLSPLRIPAGPFTPFRPVTPSQNTLISTTSGKLLSTEESGSKNSTSQAPQSELGEGELEDSESSDVEIYLSSLGLENGVPNMHIPAAPESGRTLEETSARLLPTQEQDILTKMKDESLSPQIPPAPLQQTIPLPDVASDSESRSAFVKPASSAAHPVVVSHGTAQRIGTSSASVTPGLTASASRDIYLEDCINLDNSSKTPNVYINGLPPHFPEEQLYTLAAPFGPIRSVRTFTRHVKESESGYGFVLFETVEAAEKCIMSLRRYRNLHPTFSKQVHKIPGISYAQASNLSPESESEINNQENGSGDGDMSFKEKMESLHDPTSTNLYMEGLPLSIDEATLAALVSPHRISSSRFFQTRLSNPPRIIAFVRLETRGGAEEIIERLHGRMVRGWNDTGSRISVRFADTAEQRELRRAERASKEGEQSSARLTIAQAALLNMRGQDLRQRQSPMLSAHQSLPDRLDRLRIDNSFYPELSSSTHLSPTGLTVDYSLVPNAEYVSPRLHTSVSSSFSNSQQRDSLSSNVDPAMLTLLNSLRGSRSFHSNDYVGRDNDIQFNIRSQVPCRTSHTLEDFGYPTQQYPLRNGYTPTEEYIMRAHAESAQRRRPPPLDLYRRRKENDSASITLGVRGHRAQASTITIPQQKIFASAALGAQNTTGDDFQASSTEFRPRPQQLEVRQDGAMRQNNAHANVNTRLTRESVQPKQSHQVSSADQQPSQKIEQYPAGHTRCSTLPHRSNSNQHQRHYQHSSMSVPSTGGATHSQETISAILGNMNSSTSTASTRNKLGNNDATTGHPVNERNSSSQLKCSNRLSYDNIKGSTQLEKHNTRLLRDSSSNTEIDHPSSLTSPALTYSSQTPSTLSPATPFFGSFASQTDGFEQPVSHGTDTKKLKAN
ncbi:hypothetical protein AX15_001749 [Amanita polypyramis BW_CC]|nr:hypothetical protein AX15_001749 [Amanita polypyramis BW_CC]